MVKVVINRTTTKVVRSAKTRTIRRVQRGDPGLGSDKNYVHDQMIPSALWTINHALGKYPSLMIVDSAGNVVEGAIQYITTEQTIVEFASAFSGKAYLN